MEIGVATNITRNTKSNKSTKEKNNGQREEQVMQKEDQVNY